MLWCDLPHFQCTIRTARFHMLDQEVRVPLMQDQAPVLQDIRTIEVQELQHTEYRRHYEWDGEPLAGIGYDKSQTTQCYRIQMDRQTGPTQVITEHPSNIEWLLREFWDQPVPLRWFFHHVRVHPRYQDWLWWFSPALVQQECWDSRYGEFQMMRLQPEAAAFGFCWPEVGEALLQNDLGWLEHLEEIGLDEPVLFSEQELLDSPAERMIWISDIKASHCRVD